ncbi:hypothetical protein E2C01_094631 [Portunus trituberculatus]|uniref:Uncharacterized protein n=1 Tax=Portunus trituberculatus TaxID=210409 RepID=A0A5B7JQZ3_PORTR|nr:hypothetical protein [Portunus trituberculatus]
MATVFHNMLPQRLKRYDYSYTYEYGSLDFSAAKPSLRPQWQSLYYPLSNEVWFAVLGVTVVLPISVYLVSFFSFLHFIFIQTDKCLRNLRPFDFPKRKLIFLST